MKPFTGLPVDLFGFDLITLGSFEPAFVNTATPDWVLFLAAAKRGFTGMITNDEGSLTQENEVRALDVTGLAVITYRKGVNDELTKWGQLMAYAPQIVKQLNKGLRGALILPTPHAVEHKPPQSLMHGIALREKVSAKELRDRADRSMRTELSARRQDNLWPG